MEEYIYDETKYIKRQDLNDFIDQMSKYDFAPEEIESQSEFNIVFQYLISLILKAPDFLQSYEYAFRMIGQLEPDKKLLELEKDLEAKWFDACERIPKMPRELAKLLVALGFYT
ncbi:hypothetical protein [Brumimicrobium sp.]|uniref:hypothetical protein n=1 Tax=Brumimicrobium sp. TaxID=2029867 RepID=UPI003A8F33E3